MDNWNSHIETQGCYDSLMVEYESIWFIESMRTIQVDLRSIHAKKFQEAIQIIYELFRESFMGGFIDDSWDDL